MFLLLLASLLLTPPVINMDRAVVEPIEDFNIGEFWVREITIAAPDQEAPEMSVVVDTVFVSKATVSDHQTGSTYKIYVRQPIVLMEDGSYAAKLKVAGGKFPLRRGQLSVEFELSIAAHTVSKDGTRSETTIQRRTFQLSKEEFLPKQ